MKRMPYSLLSIPALKRLAKKIEWTSEPATRKNAQLHLSLKHAEIEEDAKTYLGMALVASFFFFLFWTFIIGIILYVAKVGDFVIFSILAGFLLSIFAFVQQLAYPKMLVTKRVRGIERNLMGALQNIMIQINSGVPLFDALVNVTASNYGEVSEEFKIAVRKISAGYDEIDALEDIAKKNPSIFFRRSIWQLINGMKAGGDISKVLGEVIGSLSDEQIVEIQRYGSQLNPLAMFYMLVAVILPSLGITFIIVLTSFIDMPSTVVKGIFFGLYGMVLFFEIMFLGIIKSRRPNFLNVD